jgi:hypothetical protein
MHIGSDRGVARECSRSSSFASIGTPTEYIVIIIEYVSNYNLRYGYTSFVFLIMQVREGL